MYATSSLHPTPRVLSTPCQKVFDPSNSFDQLAVPSGSNYSLNFAETLYGPIGNAFNINLEEANEGSKKKKVSSTDSTGITLYLFFSTTIISVKEGTECGAIRLYHMWTHRLS
jgi:hypothetical protein